MKHPTDCTDGRTGYGAHQYGRTDGNGNPGAFRWISLVFFRGTDFHDPAELPEGSGKRLRHVKLGAVEDIEQPKIALRGPNEMASQLGDGWDGLGLWFVHTGYIHLRLAHALLPVWVRMHSKQSRTIPLRSRATPYTSVCGGVFCLIDHAVGRCVWLDPIRHAWRDCR